ncbi:uncharacterized protein [Physcomitrium patens]|uniref:uncharacterized protein isoform X2 n=2 Tax=Physcomitrium patens TaxID=3218 RepID=UPI000D1717F4|nr:uncharacterized protein LOC112281756 isoform X2 [Physcomitrium patens]|eukprot:XP_024374389.1 uncharacterized protein LOC112281756 isoform X2 [Physcomitrella patens]
MMEQLVNFVIRPPRADYSPSFDLLSQEFLLKSRKFTRKDLQAEGMYYNVVTTLPCLRSKMNHFLALSTVMATDFSGSGLSDGNYVSLGWNEKDDLKAVVNHLRTDEKVSRIGLWGRSMGAVTCLMYGAQDPSIACMVLDSPFANLNNLMMELVDVYKIRLPKFTVKVAVQYMRKAIQKKAHFDIMDLDAVPVAKKCFIPALFGHATDDAFIHSRHSEIIFKDYIGDKNIIKFDGDHNSPRPQFYYDSIAIFLYNVLRPPDALVVIPEAVPELQFYDDALDLNDVDEDTLFEMLRAVRPSSSNTGSSPAGCTSSNSLGSESKEESLSQTRSRWQMSRTVVPVELTGNDNLSSIKDIDSDGFEGTCSFTEGSENADHPSHANTMSLNEGDKCWAPRVVGAGHASPSCEQSFAYAPSNSDDEDRMVLEAIAASLHDVDTKEAEQKSRNEAVRHVVTASTNSSRLDTFRQRLRSTVFRAARRNDSK